jgi:RmuC family
VKQWQIDSAIRFRFGALEARLADMHEIDSAMRSKFQARLKNLHRLGYPAGIGGTAGKATLYDEGQAAQMALAVELTQLGLPPERLIEVYERNSYPIHMAIVMASRALLQHPDGFDANEVSKSDPLSMFLFFDPAALAPLMTGHGQDEDRASASFFYGGSGIVTENLVRWTTGASRRISLINVTTMLWDLAEPLGKSGQEIFLNAVNRWADVQVRGGDFDIDSWMMHEVWSKTFVRTFGSTPEPKAGVTLMALVKKLGFTDYAGTYYDVPEATDGPAPDLVLHLPGQRSLLVDAQVTQVHELRARVEYLCGHPFRSAFTDAANYVVLYVPTERLLDEALREDPGLLDQGFRSRVVLADPRKFRAILEAIEVAWDERLRPDDPPAPMIIGDDGRVEGDDDGDRN